MLTLLPTRMLFTSPRTTSLNQTLQSFPISTSPSTTAFSAMKQLVPNFGVKPRTVFIIDKVELFLLRYKDRKDWKLLFLKKEMNQKS